jgi:chaperonin GroES
MKIKPLNDWAVIRPSEAEDRTAGGIYIPETAKEKPAEGIVEAIGPGAFEEEKRGAKKEGKKERKFIAATVKPGERVLYERYAGQKITIDGEERVLVREVNILGTLPPAAARPKEDLPPLMLPAATASASSRAVAKRETTAVTVKKEAAKPAVRTAARKTAAKKSAAPKTTAPRKGNSKKAKKKR